MERRVQNNFWTVGRSSNFSSVMARFWPVKMLRTSKSLVGIHKAANRDLLISILRIYNCKQLKYFFYDLIVNELMWMNLFFPVIYLKAVHLTGHNDRSTSSLSGQMVILAGHCPSTGRYFEPWKRYIQFRKFLSQERTQIIGLSRVHNKQAWLL